MTYITICREHRHEERFWVCQERLFPMPVTVTQIVRRGAVR